MKRRIALRVLLACAVLLLVTLALEVCVFNFRTLQSMGYTPTQGETVFLPGVRDNADGTITVLSSDTGERGIEFVGLDTHIDNAFVDIGTADGMFEPLEVFFMSTDAGNALYFLHPSVTVVEGEPASHYLRMNLAGDTPKMKLRLDALEGQTLRFGGVRFNVPRPLMLEPLRMAFVFCVLGFFALIRMRGTLFADTLGKGSAVQLCAVLAVLLVLIAFSEAVMMANPLYADPPWAQHRQYAWLAQSFSRGEVALDRPVAPELAAMENPYDPHLRYRTTEFEWDVAFYDGAYYCYFGVVPCVLFYLPFYLLTGYGLDNLWVVMLTLPIFLAGVFAFFYLLLRRYAPGTRFGVYLLLSTAAALGSGTAYAIRHPDFYVVPMVTGLMFTVWGLALWLFALRDGKPLRRWALCLGSLMMALVAGCRPQLVLASGFALFIFAPMVRKKETRASDWAAFWTPYVLVAVVLMAYNAARFSSPLDLGANYNLTNADMTALGMNWERALIALFTSFLQPMNISTAFPFLQANMVETSFQGTLIVDAMFGGLLHASPILWVGAFCFLWRDVLKTKKLYGLCLYSLGSCFFLCAFDTMGAGLLYRYILDFAFFAFVAAVLTTACVMERLEGRALSRAYTVTRIACAATAVSVLLLLVAPDFANWAEQVPQRYEHLRVLTEFWH